MFVARTTEVGSVMEVADDSRLGAEEDVVDSDISDGLVEGEVVEEVDSDIADGLVGRGEVVLSTTVLTIVN